MLRILLHTLGTTLATAALVIAVGHAQATPAAPAPLDGTWNGTVTSDMGEMAITAGLVTKNGVVSGFIKNFHGEFKIADGRLVEGKWVLPFTTDEGGKGKLTGTVKDAVFAGEWDFRPQAFGTFELTRSKSHPAW